MFGRRSVRPGLGGSASEFAPTEERFFPAPVRIGVISDTHLYPGGRRSLPAEIIDLFRRFECGLIVHAGDANTLEVLAELGEIAPLIAVTGNNDDSGMRRIVPRQVRFRAGRFSIALLHGDGGTSARAEARNRFAGEVDLVIYGHSHIPMIEQVEGTTFFNPGSPTDKRWHPHFGIGLIEVSEDRLRPELILFSHPAELVNINPD